MCQPQLTDHNRQSCHLSPGWRIFRRSLVIGSAVFGFLWLSLDCLRINKIQSFSKIKFPSISDEFKSSSWSFCSVSWLTRVDNCSFRLVSTLSFSISTFKSLSFQSSSVVDFSSSRFSLSVTSVHSEHSLGAGAFDIFQFLPWWRESPHSIRYEHPS